MGKAPFGCAEEATGASRTPPGAGGWWPARLGDLMPVTSPTANWHGSAALPCRLWELTQPLCCFFF